MDTLFTLPERAWVEVDLDQIKKNYRTVREYLREDCPCLAIVKGNGYGAGMLPIALALQGIGCRHYGVSALSEALELREHGIKGLVLLLGYTYPDNILAVAANDISVQLADYKTAKEYSDILAGQSLMLKVHIKVDTGMSRTGMRIDGNIYSIADEIAKISSLPGICIEGIFTHFSSAYNDYDKEFTVMQFEKFLQIIDETEKRGIKYEYRHCANSPASREYPFTQLDMIRCGATLYGLYKGFDGKIDVAPAVSMRTRIVKISDLPAGTSISYDRTCVLDEDKKVAVVSVGNGDGYLRFHSNRSYMLVNGKHAPVLGIVCMDMTMLDVSDIPEVRIGDVVTVFGEDHGAELTAEQLVADVRYMIPNELYNGVTMRIPKVYFENGKPTCILRYKPELSFEQ